MNNQSLPIVQSFKFLCFGDSAWHFLIRTVGPIELAPGLRTSTATLPRYFEAAREETRGWIEATLSERDPLTYRLARAATRGRSNYPSSTLSILMFVVVALSFLVQPTVSLNFRTHHKSLVSHFYECANDFFSCCLKLKMLISRFFDSARRYWTIF